MTLTYRGVDYVPSFETTTEASPGKVGGKYRGLDWRFRHLTKAPIMQTNLDMVYRGIAVHPAPQPVAPQTEQVPQPAFAAVGLATDPVHPVSYLARTLLMGHQRTLKIRQQSMLFRVASEVGLTGDVGTYWNKIQGKVHPTFRDTLDRSHATMS